MGNVTLPTPVAVAGGAICVLGGYLLGVVAGPDAPTRATATVESYDGANGRLCLRGQTVEDQEGTAEGELLCGRWRRPPDAETPQPGDAFRYVSTATEARSSPDGEPEPVTLIYGGVVD